MKKILIFAAATMLLGSCGLYNKYERPSVDTQGLIRDVESDVDTLAVAPQDTASFGNLPWRAVFTDPQLQAQRRPAECGSYRTDVRVDAEGSQVGLPASH